MAKILVTGATGFIGKQLVLFLQAQGHDLRCSVWKYAPWLSVEQIVINRLENTINWKEALKGIDIVIHLAARVHILNDKDSTSTDKFIEINSEGTKNLALQAAQYGVKRFIFLSSIKVNGEYTETAFDENCQAEPQDIYAKSKWLAEQHLTAIQQSTGMETVILRPPLVYGPGVKANFLKLIQIVDKGWPLPFANVHNQRSFIYLDNLIHAINSVLFASAAAGRVFLVSDDEPWSLPDLIQTIAQNLGHQPRLFSIPVQAIKKLSRWLGKEATFSRLFESLVVSNKTIKNVIGWQPPISGIEGLAKTVQWYQQEFK